MGKNICAIFTGGTICCSRMEGYGNIKGENPYLLLDLYREKEGDKCTFHTVEPYRTLSENMSGDKFGLLANCVAECLAQKPDGIIVTHGTDTLQYSSALLAYLFHHSPVPIVMVSSNYPLLEPKSNGLDNLIYAIRFIEAQAGSGVFVSYRNVGDVPRIHRGTRLLAHPAYQDEVFSVYDQFYGHFEGDTFIKNPAYTARKDEAAAFTVPAEVPAVCREILRMEPYVGLQYPPLTDDIRAVVHGGFHTGGFRTEGEEFLSFVARCRERQIPIFLTGALYGYTYGNHPEFYEHGVHMLPVAAPIAMYVKLWLALMQGRDLKEVMFSSMAEDLLNEAPAYILEGWARHMGQ